MPPNIEQKKFRIDIPSIYKTSYPELKYPSLRLTAKTPDLWIKGKQLDDNAEGLWRVHDKLYDLTEFISKHPGGKFWLNISKGTDITEAFESHHIATTAEKVLPEYYVRDAVGPRNSPFTFKEDGFYRTLKRKTAPVLKELQRNHKSKKSMYIIDLLLIGAFVLGIFTVASQSYIFAMLAGVCLSMTTIAAHNFFHQRDNFRMYYFNILSMTVSEWRMSHVLSHHLYTNTLQDYEISVFEPILQYLPTEKTFVARYLSMFYCLIFYLATFFSPLMRRLVRIIRGSIQFEWNHLIPFILPTIMYLTSGQSILNVIFWWILISTIGSFHFTFVGLNAAHHHPHIFHDGDVPREDRDWGLNQLDAVMDRYDINSNSFLVLTNFGEHTLHHLYPTVDHELLPKLLPVVQETCKEFNVQLRLKSQIELILGQFKQLARVKPNDKPVTYYYDKNKNE